MHPCVLSRLLSQMRAVRHERPWHDWESKDDPSASVSVRDDKDAWWQWFELNPLEVRSEELEG